MKTLHKSVKGNHDTAVVVPHKSQRCGALMFLCCQSQHAAGDTIAPMWRYRNTTRRKRHNEIPRGLLHIAVSPCEFCGIILSWNLEIKHFITVSSFLPASGNRICRWPLNKWKTAHWKTTYFIATAQGEGQPVTDRSGVRLQCYIGCWVIWIMLEKGKILT